MLKRGALLVLFFSLPAFGEYKAVPLDGFADAIKHWHDRTAEADKSYYRPEQIVDIADNLLVYQRSNGGWPTNRDPLRILSDEERKRELADKQAQDTSLDNRNTYPQIEYLAQVYQQTEDNRYRNAALNGIRFILDHQYENGGWAHSPPSIDGYRAHITFMDDVMPGVLGLLRKVAAGNPPFDFVDSELRMRAEKAVRKGDKLVLQLQIVVDGKPTVWAGQYDRITLQPVQARSYELAGLVSWESVTIVRYLMSIETPAPEIICAIESAIKWFQKS